MTPGTLHQHPRAVALVGILTIYLTRLVVADALVPPWQGPDEPQHVYLATVLAHGYAAMPELEAAVVASMYHFGWWEYYQQERPATVPDTFRQGPALVTEVRGAPGGPRLYHEVAALLLRTLHPPSLEAEYRVLRLFSAACGMGTVLLAWYTNRRVFGEVAGTLSAVILALHPQFMLVSLSANPDAAIMFLGAVVWTCTASAIDRSRSPALIFAALAAAATATLMRRLGFPLLVDVGVAAAITVAVIGTARLTTVVLGAVVIVSAAIGIASLVSARVQTAALSSIGTIAAVDAFRTALSDPAFVVESSWDLFTSFWLHAGWLRFPAPSWWYAAIVVVCLGAVVGGVRAIGSIPVIRRPVLRFAVVVVLLQVVAALLAYLPLHTSAQGRYLMPAALPLAGVLATGLLGLARTPADWGRIAAVATVGFAVLDALAWLLVLLPAYASPV